MVGERIEVFWPDDAARYDGEIAVYSVENGKHTVSHEDGDEDIVLANEFILKVDARTANAMMVRRASKVIDLFWLCDGLIV